MRALLLFLIVGIMSSCVAQVTLQFKLNAAPFLLNQRLNLTPDSQIQIEQFKCYLGDGYQHYYLVDASDSTTYLLPEVHRVLQVGMDSIANTSDRLDCAFDPLLGMYWAWNTGYIQLKVIGQYYTSGTVQPFEYHIGGYTSPNLTSGTIQLMADQQSLTVNLEHLFLALPYVNQPRVMMPGPLAKSIHNAFVICFK